MRTRSKTFSKVMLWMLLVALTLAFCVPVAAATNSTVLTTTVPEMLPLHLELSGHGTVWINSIAYTQSGTIEISRNATVQIQITPDTGNSIQSVSYNGDDLTNNMVSGMLTLPIMTSESSLHVTFIKDALIPPTGDTYHFSLSYLLVLMIISLFGIMAMLIVKKKSIH